jgi:aminoglycoside/choline kinase family phosphotransferase
MYGFLMSGAGDTLRPILKNKKYDVTLPTRALKIYADMQIQCIPHVQTLLNNAGVNDWRLEKLPKLYKNFIENEKLLLDDGLVEADIKNLKNFYSKFEGLCESLVSLGIPETLEQGDFQDNNILIQENKVTLHDFGDASITHPFFSLSSFLNSAARHHGIQESDEVYQALYESYMGPWYTCYSEKSCFKAFKQAKIIGLFVFALSFTRIKACPGIEAFPEYNGYISEALKLLIKNTV